MIDCGASSLVSMRRFDIDPGDIELILLSHLHGDHFGGIPFLLLEAQFVSGRSAPLTIAGPPGTPKRLREAAEALFPGSWDAERSFSLELVELEPGHERALGAARVHPYEVSHPSGAPALALRIACEGRVLCYSGDTEWTETLVPAAQGADLLIAEAYFAEKRVPFHLDFHTLAQQLPRLGAKRVILTHMSADMLGRLHQLDVECAEDGLSIEL